MNEAILKRRAARVARGLKQSEAAHLLGLSQSRYSRIESGLIVPDAELRQRIAALLDVPVGELFASAAVLQFPSRATPQ